MGCGLGARAGFPHTATCDSAAVMEELTPLVTPGRTSETRGQSSPSLCPAGGMGGGGRNTSPAPAQPCARAAGQCLVPASSIPALHEVKSFFLLEGQLSWAPHWKERGTDPPGSRGIEEGCSGAIQERKGCLGPCAGPSPLPVLTSVSPTCAPTQAPTSPQSSAGAGSHFPRRGKAGAQKSHDHRHWGLLCRDGFCLEPLGQQGAGAGAG